MDIINRGSTAIIKRYKPNVVIKCIDRPPSHDNINHFEIEKQILEILGHHPRIINFLGTSREPKGLLFTEANHGDLQNYLDSHNADISQDLRLKWCLQAVEAIAYLHSKGVIHSDLRPENFLLHTYIPDLVPDLLLSDFGGSCCNIGNKIIDGGHLHDTGFFNPKNLWTSTKHTDIFALGSVVYTIMTGHWPYKSSGPFVSVEEWEEYEEKVDALFMKGEFLSTEGLVDGDVISDCWNERIGDAGVIVERYEALMGMRGEEGRRDDE